MNSHTSGPWRVIETNLLPHHGDHVADMSNGLMVVPSFAPLGSPLADARLISAAPDLLEALREMVAMCSYFDEDPDRQTSAIDAALAAIAKATT